MTIRESNWQAPGWTTIERELTDVEHRIFSELYCVQYKPYESMSNVCSLDCVPDRVREAIGHGNLVGQVVAPFGGVFVYSLRPFPYLDKGVQLLNEIDPKIVATCDRWGIVIKYKVDRNLWPQYALCGIRFPQGMMPTNEQNEWIARYIEAIFPQPVKHIGYDPPRWRWDVENADLNRINENHVEVSVHRVTT